jgi:hypothetical protein
METLGELILGRHRFPIHHATFRRVSGDGQGEPGWDFEIDTQPPIEEPTDDTERFMFATGVRFYAEGDPIPLADAEDLTGVDVYIEEPFDPESGEVYFTLYVGEHGMSAMFGSDSSNAGERSTDSRCPPWLTACSKHRPSCRSRHGSQGSRRDRSWWSTSHINSHRTPAIPYDSDHFRI